MNEQCIPPHAPHVVLPPTCPAWVIYCIAIVVSCIFSQTSVRTESCLFIYFYLMSPHERFQQLEKSMGPSVAQRHQIGLTREVMTCMLSSGPTLVEKTRDGRSSTPVPRQRPLL